MSEILFKSLCPSIYCDDETVYKWYHDGCPSSSNEYLTSEAEIRCDYCGKRWDFFNSLFQCEKSNNQWKKAELKRAMNCFTALFMAGDMTSDFLIKIKDSLIKQEKKYK